MTFGSLCLAIIGILSTATLISLIVIGYIIAFSWRESIKLIENSLWIATSKKALARNYQHRKVICVKKALNRVYHATDSQLIVAFKNTDLKDVAPDKIRQAAKKALSYNDNQLYSINEAKIEITQLYITSWYQAYRYLSHQIANWIIDSYQKPINQLSKREAYVSALVINTIVQV